MGIWDKRNFGNDDALDFVENFQMGDVQELEVAINNVAQLLPEDYLDATECALTLAACEIIASMKGNASEDMPEDLKGIQPAEELDRLSLLAIRAVDRIILNSELKDLWQESTEYSDWLAVQEDLKKRLT